MSRVDLRNFDDLDDIDYDEMNEEKDNLKKFKEQKGSRKKTFKKRREPATKKED